MTHARDDGDLEIEEWEKADAEMAARGLGIEERRSIWYELRSDEARQNDELLAQVMESHGCSDAEAHRIIYELNGVIL